MLKLRLDPSKEKRLEILCLGAHADDLEIGCGGAILKILAKYHEVNIDWIVFSADGDRQEEALKSANEFLAEAGKKNIIIKDFRDGFFPYIGTEIKEYFEQIKKEISADIIFTHCSHDLHQDHRLISELTWNTFRNHLILEYEVIKYDGDLGHPNFFVHLDENIVHKKIHILMESFKTQEAKNWFTPDAFLSILRLRGLESRAPEKYAEGFYCKKAVI